MDYKKLKLCIKKKYRLFNYLKRGLISRREFNVFKNTLIWVTKKIKNNYYAQKFKSNSSDKKKTWHEINTLLNRKRKPEVDYLIGDDNSILNGDLSGNFNDYFVDCVSRLVNHIPNDINYELLNNVPFNDNSCFLIPTNFYEITDIMKNIKNKGDRL